MAEVSNGASALQTSAHIPIAQLTPLLAAPASRSIKAVVTLTWPYSSAKGSVAFALSEPDFRLRRTRGQVIVRFSGSSAKVVAKSGIASGDQVTLSLDGAEYGENTEVMPGRGVEFELKFTERLLLQFQQEGFEKVHTIDIDHPEAEPEVVAAPRIPTPELAIPTSVAGTVASSGPLDSAINPGAEYNSPAFIKRARTSYGSLFESDYDPFLEEDGTVPGKGRKRTRLSSTWKYSSRSPTPEVEVEIEAPPITPPEVVTRLPPAMTDEGCQTIGLEDGNAAEALANFARQCMNVGTDSYAFPNGASAQKAMPQPEAFLENSLSTDELPAFHFQQFNSLAPLDTIQLGPQSPRLQPVPSELLPQVSPLLSRNAFSPTNTQSGGIGASQSPPAQTQAVHNNFQRGGADVEDLYDSSPTGRQEEQAEADVSGFQNLPVDIDGIEQPGLGNHFSAEDQYGHWQSSTHLSHNASPYPPPEEVVEDVQADRFYIEEGGEEVEQYSHNGVPASHAEVLHSHQYPEIDDGLPNHQLLPEWGVSNVQYPELQNYGLEELPLVNPPQPRSTAMSRSQNAHSQVVDLTESSDEEGEGPADIALEEDASEREDEEEGEEILEEDEEGSLDEQEEVAAGAVRSPYFSQGDAQEDEEAFEGEESEEEEQYYYEEEFMEDGADAINERFNVPPGQEFYDEEEEDSYESEDEGLEDEPIHRPPVQKETVFIDLLSSDDEESGPPPQPKPMTSASTRYTRSHESEESETDEDEEEAGEEEIPYAEREKLEVHVANRNRSSEELSDDDERMEDEREQDDLDQPVEHIEDASSIAAQGERHLAPQFIAESADDQAVTEHGVGNDLVNIRAQDQVRHVESKNLGDTVSAEVESYVKASTIPGQFRRSQTSPTKSLFKRMFNLDGANDESEDEVSYPELPEDENSRPVIEQQITTQPSEILFQRTTNTQLPTPDATQSFGQTVSTETSFTSTTDILPAHTDQLQGSDGTTIKMETEQLEVILSASGPVDIEVEMEQIETTLVTTETAKISLSDDDVEMSREGTQLVVEQLDLTKVEASEDQIVDEPIAEEEYVTDAAEPEAVGHGRFERQISDNEESLHLAEPDSIKSKTVQDQIDDQIMEEKLALHVAEADSITAEEVQEQIDEQFAEEEHMMDIAEPKSTVPEDIQEQVNEQVLQDEFETKTDVPDSISHELAQDFITVQKPVNDTTKYSITVDPNPLKQIESLESALKEPGFTIDSPRRSNRRAKPSAIVANTKENIRPTTPNSTDKASVRTRKEPTSPEVVLETRAPPKGHDASIELALASLESPSKPKHDLRKAPVADLKLRLSRALRTELSEFTALKVLRYHLNQKLDVLAVATTTPDEPQRAKNGPRHYQITFNVTDPSIAPSSVTEIQIFRPYKDALPTIKAGDGILLRNFQVTSVKNRGFGMRSVTDEGSSWAVFKDSGEPEVRGPPVEFGDGEKNHLIALRDWYGSLDAAAMGKINRANGDKLGVGVGKSIAKAS